MAQQYKLFQSGLQRSSSRNSHETFEPLASDPTDVLEVCVDVFSCLPNPVSPVSIVLAGDIDTDVQTCEQRLTDILTALFAGVLQAVSDKDGCTLSLHAIRSCGGLLLDLHSNAEASPDDIEAIRLAVGENLIWEQEVSQVTETPEKGWMLRTWINLNPKQTLVPWLAVSDGQPMSPLALDAEDYRSRVTGLRIVLG